MSSNPRHALQQRVASTILEAAARVIAARGGRASMHDVAAEAGVARATVYRYFPNRKALLDELAQIAVTDAAERLAAARIDQLPVEEAVPRAVRALVDVGDPFVVLVREQWLDDGERVGASVVGPLEALFARGQASGDLRPDVSSARLVELFLGVVMSLVASSPQLGRDDLVALVGSLFLDGARRRQPMLHIVT